VRTPQSLPDRSIPARLEWRQIFTSTCWQAHDEENSDLLDFGD
jgi:hypothetical protein